MRWPGGKRWLTPTIAEIVGNFNIRHYFEPFLGGGAVYFALQPKQATLSDVNSDLINTYLQVRDSPEEILERLKRLPVNSDFYSVVRKSSPTDPVQSAVRFLYLNRTAFAGMYRVNRSGAFNVPFGGGERKPDPLWNEGLLLSASKALSAIEITCNDFEISMQRAQKGDLVYCDPTYTVSHNNNGFIRYNESNFRWDDQVRLARACSALRARGVTVIVSNAFHGDVLQLYSDAEAREVGRLSLLCPDGGKRKHTSEYLFILHP